MRIAPLACALALAFAGGCGPKLVRESVFSSEAVSVELQRSLDGSTPLPLGHDHPAQIAAVRLAHILAALAYSDPKDVTQPVIRTAHVYDLAEGVAQALGRAGPDDAVVAVANSHDRRLGIFSDHRATSFKAYVHGGQLRLDFFAIEHDWRDDDRRADAYKVPSELPESRPPFKLLPGTAMAAAGERGLAIDWRDDYFRKPVNLSLRYGQVRRRTILMESEDIFEETDPSALPAREVSTDAQIRALDQLDAVRRAGLIPEAEFQRRRRLIMQGRLEDAGYEEEAP